MRLILVATLLPWLGAQDFHLQPNDTVVFYGDSITDQRLYTAFVETFVLTRFPQTPVRFVHSGWGGDRVSGGAGGTINERLARDVFPYQPTVVTIMLGMNDGRYRPYEDQIYQAYSSGYERMLDLIKAGAPQARLTLIQPSPYDDVTRAPTFPEGYNSILLRFSAFVRELAQRQGHHTADLNTGVAAMLRRAYGTNPALAQRIIPDRVHPGPSGHLVMALELLKAWGAPPVVSAVEIDAAKREAVFTKNTAITNLKREGAGWTWMQQDQALPMPLPDATAETKLAASCSDFWKFNQQWLKITGLAGDFTLKISGLKVGDFTGTQLAEGINLAELDTPMMRQAAIVHSLTVKRTNVHQIRWRQIQMPFEKEGFARLPALLSQLDALDADLELRQRNNARVPAVYYELVPVRK
jgi:lysophospholipase L1-like esterase